MYQQFISENEMAKVTRVPIQKEHWLMSSSGVIASSLLHDSLASFTILKLIEEKLVTKSFKSGLDFKDSRSYKMTLNRLCKLLETKLDKDIPYLKTLKLVKPFIDYAADSNGYATLNFLAEDSVTRYLRRINGMLARKDIPVRFSAPVDTSIGAMAIHFRYVGNGSQYRRLYLLALYLPQMLDCLKTLHRKALYADSSHRNIFEYKRSLQGVI